MDGVDFENLSTEQEDSLRAILKHCRYLHGSANWNLGESILREMHVNIARDYAAFEKAAKKTAQPSAQIDGGSF
jgi:hypothetical protein